jgi:GAF domain-containing protein
VLQTINSSPGDLTPVFDAILEKAVRVCNADQGALYRRDGEGYRQVALIGMSAEYTAAVAERLPMMPGTRSCVGLTALQGRVVQFADIAADPEYASRETITLGMARTGIGVPLLRDGETIGVFGLARRRVELFSDKQIALLQNFAAQAVIAMEIAAPGRDARGLRAADRDR